MKKDSKPNKKIDKTTKVIIGVCVAVCVVAGGIYADTFYGSGKLKSYATQIFQQKAATQEAEVAVNQKQMAMDEGTRGSMAVFGKSFLLCTKDGVKYFNDIGDQKWNDTFTMVTPQLVQEGKYVAVGDLSGKTIRVYDQNGVIYTVQGEGRITQFGLNENGYLSMITKETTGYRILVYNASGVLLKGRMEDSDGIFPMSCDVSDDNKSFAVSYMDTSDIEPIGRVLFFYINPEDSEAYTDSMFAAVEKTGEMIPAIGYRNGGSLMAISDRAVYGISQAGKETWSYPLTNTVTHGDFSDKNYVVLALGEALSSSDGVAAGRICWLDINGKEGARYESGALVTYLNVTNLGVVIGNERTFTGLKHTGKAAWSYRAAMDVREILPMEHLNQVMVLTKDAATITEMKGETSVAPTVPTEEIDHKPEVVGGTPEVPLPEGETGAGDAVESETMPVPQGEKKEESGETPTEDPIATPAEGDVAGTPEGRTKVE